MTITSVSIAVPFRAGSRCQFGGASIGCFASPAGMLHLPCMTDAHGHRLTRNEDIVLDALRQAARPLSAYQIMEQTTSRGVRAPQQIYRALQGLVGHRLIHRIETINAYLACQH